MNRRVLSFGVLLGVLVGAGCGGPPTGPDVESLQTLAISYRAYASVNKGAGPVDETQFHTFLASSMDPSDGNAATRPKGKEAFAKFLTSTRDGQPFVVLYGRRPSLDPQSRQVLAHEQTGSNGKRLVVFATTEVEELPAAEVERLAAQ